MAPADIRPRRIFQPVAQTLIKAPTPQDMRLPWSRDSKYGVRVGPHTVCAKSWFMHQALQDERPLLPRRRRCLVSAEIACTQAAGLSGQETADVPGVDLAHAVVAREDVHRLTGIGEGRSVAPALSAGSWPFLSSLPGASSACTVRAVG
jgi:hypothetical protein